MVGPKEAQQNQEYRSQEIGKCRGALDNGQDQGEGTAGTVGAQKRGAHNPAWGGREGFLELVVFQLSLEGEGKLSPQSVNKLVLLNSIGQLFNGEPVSSLLLTSLYHAQCALAGLGEPWADELLSGFIIFLFTFRTPIQPSKPSSNITSSVSPLPPPARPREAL